MIPQLLHPGLYLEPWKRLDAQPRRGVSFVTEPPARVRVPYLHYRLQEQGRVRSGCTGHARHAVFITAESNRFSQRYQKEFYDGYFIVNDQLCSSFIL